MFRNYRLGLYLCLLASLPLLHATLPCPALGDIYQWEWIDPSDPSKGKRESTTLCPDGAGVRTGYYYYFYNGLNLSQAYLIDANISNCFCDGTIFTNADFSHSNLSNTTFCGADLTAANFANAQIQGADFTNHFPDTDPGINRNQLESTASYQSYDLTGVRLGQKNLSGWNFHSQNLTDVDFSYSRLEDTDFSDAIVRGTYFECNTSLGLTQSQLQSTRSYKIFDLIGIRFRYCDLNGWNFQNQNLTNAEFSESNLSNANFLNAIVQGATFDGSTSQGFSLPQLQSTASYQAHDLTRIRLEYCDNLDGWDFQDQNLTSSSFYCSKLGNANFSRAILTNASFENCNLIGTIFTNAQVRGAIFSESVSQGFEQSQLQSTASYQAHDLSCIQLAYNDLSDWDFYGQDLTKSNFRSSSLNGANFNDAIIKGANFSNSSFSQYQLESTASYQNHNLTEIKFSGKNLRGWNFSEQDLTSAVFNDADLTDANFARANVTNAPFNNAILTNINFAGANLTNAGFYYATLTKANFAQANLTDTCFPNAKLTNANFAQAIFSKTNFSYADLSNVDLTQANLANCNFSCAMLTGTVFTSSNVQGADLSQTIGFTQPQLQSTASYQAKDLSGIVLNGNNMSNWFFCYQNLSNARFESAILTNSNFTLANLTHASFLNAQLKGAGFWNTQLTGVNFTNAQINGVYFCGTRDFTQSQFQSTANFQAHVFQSVNFSDIDLHDWDFHGQNLQMCYFSHVNLKGAGFTKTNLMNSSFDSVELNDASFTQANLNGTSFSETDLTNADFTNAKMQDVNFCKTKGFTQAQLQSTSNFKANNLSGIGLLNIDLGGWDFHNQNLCNARFDSSTLTDTNFTNANVQEASFRDTTSKGFTFAQLQSTASYKNYNLQGIRLESNDLTNWDLNGQNLHNTSFKFCTLTGTNFTNADVKRADFSNTTSRGFTQVMLQSTANYLAKDLTGMILGYNDLSNWDFHNCNLAYVQFGNSKLIDANFTNAIVQGAVFCNDKSTGITQEQFQSTASYRNHNLQEIYFWGTDLSGWDLHAQNLQYASFSNCDLHGTNFSDADVKGVCFDSTISKGFTLAMLQSTASYKACDLKDVEFSYNELTDWDFHDQNLQGVKFWFATLMQTNFHKANLTYGRFMQASLTSTNFSQATLMNAEFPGANFQDIDFSAADTRGSLYVNFDNAITNNMIYPDGTIRNLDLSGEQVLPVHNYFNRAWYQPPQTPIPITIQTGMTLGGTGTLEVIFDGKPWNSTISFEADIPVDCNGTLDLTIDQNANVLAQLGRTCKLFDWSGVNPTGAFKVTSLYNWDTTQLYTIGEVSLEYSPNLSDTKWTGKLSGSWNNAANWTAGLPAAGKVIEFNAASPTHQPFLQNIGDPFRVKGILFAPSAGSHYLAGPTLLFAGDAPAIASMSKNDQFIGNPIELDADTVVNVTDTGVLNLAGDVSGSGQLTKAGTGTLLLLANNHGFSGAVEIEAGVLALDATGQLENSPITNDATFQIHAGDHTTYSITGNGVTEILSGSLTTTSIVQDTLSIGSPAPAAAQSVPEPCILALMLTGMLGLFAWKFRQRK